MRSKWGDFDRFFAEIADHQGTVVISSEDFEGSLLHPERWQRVIGKANASGWPVTFVVYRRPVIDQLLSVYQELVRDGQAPEFSAVAREVLQTGQLRARDWQFCFDYAALADSLSRIDKVRVVFRDYADLAGGSTISDFAEFLGLAKDPLFFSDWRSNPRLDLPTILMLFLTLRAPELKPVRPSVHGFLGALLGGRPTTLAMPEAMRAAFGTRFGAAGPTPGTEPPQNAEAVNVERVFSLETQITLHEAFELAASGATQGDTNAANRVRSNTARWRAWVSDLT